MSDATNSPADQPMLRVRLTVSQILQGIKENFVVVSALAFAIGVALATTFLAAYLSVFDWHLMWFVQYTDILTFGLIAVGVISGSLTFIQSASQTVIGLFGMSGWSRRSHAALLAAFIRQRTAERLASVA